MNRVGKEFNDFCIIVGEPEIGDGTWVGYFTLLDGSGGLKIGRHCSISSGVQIYTHDTTRWSIEGLEKDIENYTHVDRAPVRIGDNVYVGANAIVLKGVSIGDQCIIGAGAVVTKSLPPRSIAIGVPARVVGHVEIHHGKFKVLMGRVKSHRSRSRV
jgi:acetyltransferase-like isoleucine patch superfamily enzyme